MNKSLLIKEILRQYDRDMQQAMYLKASREAEIYTSIPQLEKIDKIIANASIEISKAILSKKSSSLNDYIKTNKRLQEEKKILIEKAGFSSDYLERIYKCNKCKDTGYIENQRCSCFNQRLISKYYNISNLGNILENENFSKFDINYYPDKIIDNEGISPRDKIKVIHQTCLNFVKNFSEEYSNLFFYGKPGLGKTFMCNCIAKALLDKGHTVLYSTAGKLFKIIEDARFNRDEIESPNEQINFFYTAELLIIDDLGTEFLTLATQSALFDIVNSRILDNSPTIISSNLSPVEVANNYSDRLSSRLQGNYSFCRFLGEDIRELKKYKFKQKK